MIKNFVQNIRKSILVNQYYALILFIFDFNEYLHDNSNTHSQQINYILNIQNENRYKLLSYVSLFYTHFFIV